MKILQKGRSLLTRSLPLVLVAIFGCQATPPDNSRPAQAMRGKAFFDEHCVVCHGESGKGDGVKAKELDAKVADLTQIVKRSKDKKFPVVAIASIIDGRNHLQAHGAREMPAWGQYFADEEQLNDTEIRGKMGELIAYLMSIQE